MKYPHTPSTHRFLGKSKKAVLGIAKRANINLRIISEFVRGEEFHHMVTRDLRSDRVNVCFDKNGKVDEVYIG